MTASKARSSEAAIPSTEDATVRVGSRVVKRPLPPREGAMSLESDSKHSD